MKKVLLTLCMFFAFIANAFPSPSPIILTAEKIEGNINTTIKATGNVTVETENAFLKSDTLFFDNSTKIIEAKGNVYFKQKNIELSCDFLKYDIKNEKAELENAKGKLSESDFITAKKLIKTSDNTWLAYDGIYTPCCCCSCDPDWSLKAKEFEITAGKTFKGKWVAFNVKSVPVLLTPYIRGPIVEKRTSGFLFPKLGYIHDSGFLIRQPFYLVLGRSADFTLTYEKRFNDGYSITGDLRYISSLNSKGNLNIGRVSTENSTDWKIELNHSSIKSDYSYGNIKLNFISSRNYYENIGTTDIEALTQQYTKSTVSYSKLQTHSILNFNLVYIDNLDGSTDATFQKLPEINYYLMDTKLGKTPFYFSFNGKATNFYRKVGFRGIRAQIEPAVRLATTTGNIKNSFKLSNFSAFYFLTNTGNGTETLNYNIFKFEEKHSTHFKIGKKRNYFSLNPQIGFLYVEDKDEKNIPDFDGTDKTEEKKQITGDLKGYFYHNSKLKLTTKISSFYDFKDRKTPFKNIVLDISTFPSKFITISEHLEFNEGKTVIDKINSNLNLNWKKLKLWANHYFSNNENDKNNYLRWGASLKLLENLDFSYSQRYDFLYRFDRERTYTLSVNRNCWRGSISYHWLRSFDGTTNYQILLTINLVKLGGYQYKYQGLLKEL